MRSFSDSAHLNTNEKRRGTNKPTTIDLVFTPNEECIENIHIYIYTTSGKSDHSISKILYSFQPDILPDKIICDYKKADIPKMKEKIAGLNVSKSSGPDKLHPRIVKELGTTLVEAFFYILRLSLKIGKLPTLKIGKNGSKNSAENYRPVSLVSITCKILESIIRESVLDYLSHQAGNLVFYAADPHILHW